MQRLVVALFVALDVVLDVAARCTAGTGATPAAFYLGLCRLRGILFPPAPHDHAAGGPFFATTTTAVGGTVLLCDEENWSRTQFVVAARCSGGAGATPAAFYLGLCRLRGILSPPAPHDFAAGGPFYFATKKIGIGRGAVATTTAAGGTVLLCRHDGAASILDFRAKLGNRCSAIVAAQKNGPPAA